MPTSPVVYRGSDAYRRPDPGPAVTIGNFDGVHLGHRALLLAAREQAGADGTVCVYTFDPPPRVVMAPHLDIPSIQSLDDKLSMLGAAGADHVVVEPFDADYAEKTADWFCDEVLTKRLGARAVVVGWDFRFGKDRVGDVDLLRARLSIPVVRVPAVAIDGEVVSSTRVRAVVHAGDLRTAHKLLGRDHELIGRVVPGDARGRRIGFPTANLALQTELVPPSGVYAVRVQADGRWHDGVANLGRRPTFAPGETRFEVHLLDYQGDLYGRPLRIALVDRLRDEKRFGGVEELVDQIGRDIDDARRVLRGAA